MKNLTLGLLLTYIILSLVQTKPAGVLRGKGAYNLPAGPIKE